MLAKMQFCSHNFIQIYQVYIAAFVNKRMYWGMISISENLMSKCQGHHMTIQRQDQKSLVTNGQIWYKILSWKPWLKLHTTKEVSGGPMCGLGILSQPAGGGIPLVSRYRFFSYRKTQVYQQHLNIWHQSESPYFFSHVCVNKTSECWRQVKWPVDLALHWIHCLTKLLTHIVALTSQVRLQLLLGPNSKRQR